MNKTIRYKLQKNKKYKRVSLSVNCDGCVLVTSPTWVPKYIVDKFVLDKKNWIRSRMKALSGMDNLQFSHDHYLQNKKKSLTLIEARIIFFNQVYNFSFNKISTRNQKTRWGSCSSRKNLNFNYRILFLPKELQDYIIIHELCHLKELNHSRDFWNLVAKTCPNYLELRKKLRKHSLSKI